MTADTHYLVDAIQDLAAGDLSGFNQNLQLIPATNIALLVFAAEFPLWRPSPSLPVRIFRYRPRPRCTELGQ